MAMDPQRRFIASTLQGALEAEVLSLKDVYRHMGAEILAEHVAPEIIWACLTEGMAAAGLGFGGQTSRPAEVEKKKAAAPIKPEPAPFRQAAKVAEKDKSAPPPLPGLGFFKEEEPAEEEFEEEVSADQVEEAIDFDVTESEVVELLKHATANEDDGINIDTDDVIEDLPPLPVDEALIVEEVNWGDEKNN